MAVPSYHCAGRSLRIRWRPWRRVGRIPTSLVCCSRPCFLTPLVFLPRCSSVSLIDVSHCRPFVHIGCSRKRLRSHARQDDHLGVSFCWHLCWCHRHHPLSGKRRSDTLTPETSPSCLFASQSWWLVFRSRVLISFDSAVSHLGRGTSACADEQHHSKGTASVSLLSQLLLDSNNRCLCVSSSCRPLSATS
jgi:hypothetical protein